MSLITPYNDIWSSKRLRTVLIVVAAMIPIVIAACGRSFFVLNDDGAVLALLRSGDARTFIISYPMSCLLVALYKLSAQIPWYSFFVLSMLSTSTATMTYAVLTNKYADTVQKLLLLSCVFYFCLFYSNNINYTAVVTLLFVSVHMLALSMDSLASKLMIALLVPLVLLTRSGDVMLILLVFSALPLILNGKSCKSIALLTAFFALLALAAIALNKYPHDSDYATYKKFNSVRSAYNDLKYPINISGVDADDEQIFNWGFPYDEELFPTKTLIENAPTAADLVEFRIQNAGFKKTMETLLRHVSEFILIAVSTLYVMYRRSFLNRAFIAIVGQVVMCIVLFLIRDVDRLSTGILFLILSGIHLMPKSVEESVKPFESIRIEKQAAGSNGDCYDVSLLSINWFMALLVSMLILSQGSLFVEAVDNWVGRGTVIRSKTALAIREKLNESPDLKNILLIPDLISSSTHYFTFTLGHEDAMLGYPSDGWLPAGWLSRSPLYYETLRENGTESFSGQLQQGKIALVYFGFSDLLRSREVYSNYINRHYATAGCLFVPKVLYVDKYISVETFETDCQ